MNKEIDQYYKVIATEPLYNIVHIWSGFVLHKAEDMVLNLSSEHWRHIKIKEV